MTGPKKKPKVPLGRAARLNAQKVNQFHIIRPKDTMRLSPEQVHARASIRAAVVRILNARSLAAAPGPRNLTELSRKMGLRSSTLSAALSTGNYDILSPEASANPATLAAALSIEGDPVTPQDLWPDWP